MDAALITAICTGVVSVLGAVTALVLAVRHQNDPGAHDGQGHAPPGDHGTGLPG